MDLEHTFALKLFIVLINNPLSGTQTQQFEHVVLQKTTTMGYESSGAFREIRNSEALS